MTTTRQLSANEQRWLDTRRFLTGHRYQLGVAAAAQYPDATRVLGTPLLSRESWLPAAPVPLDRISLGGGSETVVQVPAEAAAALDLPERPDGSGYPSYSAVIGELAAPAVFENRPTYRLLAADLVAAQPSMRFGTGWYFDTADVGDAAAHETAAARLGQTTTGFRAAVGDPCDPTHRPTNVAISTLTLRREAGGDTSFVLHWRDPAKVGHAGGLHHVVPTGVFQPSNGDPRSVANDFGLWRNILREFAEELAGGSEDYGDGPVDYDGWPFAQRLGGVSRYCLGLGVDPLTLATDLLTVVVVDAPLYDELLLGPSENTEGEVLERLPFDQATVEEFVERRPMQAAGAALLSLAWRHRANLH